MFKMYHELGGYRSLDRLHQKGTKTLPNPPSLRTLKYWSTRFHWQAKLSRLFDIESAKNEDILVEHLYAMRKKQEAEEYHDYIFKLCKKYAKRRRFSIADSAMILGAIWADQQYLGSKKVKKLDGIPADKLDMNTIIDVLAESVEETSKLGGNEI